MIERNNTFPVRNNDSYKMTLQSKFADFRMIIEVKKKELVVDSKVVFLSNDFLSKNNFTLWD